MTNEALKAKLEALKSAKDDLQDLYDKLEEMESDAYDICAPDLSDFLSTNDNSDEGEDEDLANALADVDSVRDEVETAIDNAKDYVSNAMEELDNRIEALEEEQEAREEAEADAVADADCDRLSLEEMREASEGRVTICCIPDPAVVAEVNDTLAEEAERGCIM